jgi:hypothetical protein
MGALIMKRKNNKIRLLVLVLLAAVLVGWALYAKFLQPKKTTNVTPTQQSLQDEVNKNAEEANKNFTGTVDNGGVADTSGAASVPTQTSTSSSSASGIITLTAPSNGAKLASGNTIAGSAKVSQVQYRIKDDSYGVLATGQLSVVNGKYSGTISIRPKGTAGTLEIFDFNANGVEENNIKITVTF